MIRSIHPARRSLTTAALVIALAGCATGPRVFPTQVTSFNDWSSLPAERRYAFAPTLEFQNSLALKSYQDLVRDELAARGFALSADAGAADLVVTLRPTVIGTAMRVVDPWPIDPAWGGAYGGFHGPGRWGGFGRGWGYGGFYDGFYGGFYDGFGTSTVEIFNRRLELDIDSRTIVGKRYYEGRVESTGDDDSLPSIMPVLIRALFTDFPGNNGQTRRIDVVAEPRPIERR